MAVLYQSFGQAFGTGSSNTPAKPSGLAVGDLMVAKISARQTSASEASFTAPSGWTGFGFANSATFSDCIKNWWKIADAGDVAASTFTFGCPNVVHVMTITRFTGAHATAPIGTTNTGTFSSTNPASVTELTLSAGDAALVSFCSGRGTTFTISAGPATEIADIQTGSTVSHHTQMLAEYDNASAGATGTFSANAASANGQFAQATQIIAAAATAPAMSTLIDDFSTQNSTTWLYSGAAAATGGQLVEPCASSYANKITSNNAYNLTGDAFAVQVVSRPAQGNGTTEMAVQLGPNAAAMTTNSLVFDLSPSDTLLIRYYAAGVLTTGATLTYDPVAMAWLRIRESGGTTFWDTSPDGNTWTNRYSVANPIAVTSLYALLITGYYGTETAPGNAIFDNVNNLPVLAAAGTAAGTGAAQAPTPKVGVAAGTAAGIGAANNPAVSVPGGTAAQAGVAAGTGTAGSPTVAASLTAGTAAGVGAAGAPAAVSAVRPTYSYALLGKLIPGVAVLGSSPVSATASPAAGTAAGTGAAQTPTVRVSASAGVASGVGAANDASVTVTGGGSIDNRTATVVENATATTITGTLPTGLANGDVLVALYANTSAIANFTGPTSQGYTALFAPININTETLAAYYKVVTNAGGETGPVASWTTSGRASCIVQAYTGVNTTTPIDVTTVTAGPTAAASLAVGGITTVTDNARVISGCAVDAAVTGTLTKPTEMNQVITTTGTGRRMTLADETKATAGATGTRTWNQSLTVAMSGWLGALRPAGGGSPPAALVHRFVGISTTDTVRVTVQTSDATSVRLKVGTDSGVTTGVVFGSSGTPSAQGMTHLTVTGLTAGVNYYYRVEMTDASSNVTLDTGTVGRAPTAPSGQASFAFNFASCCDNTDSASMAAIAARADELFFHLGDFYYADGTGTTTTNIRNKLVARIQATNHASVFSTTPSTYTPSDHDAAGNNSTAGTDATAWTNWNTVYRELFPTPTLPGGSTGVYYTFAWGRVRFVQLDTRSFKSDPAATDNSSKTALGTTQKQWFKDVLTDATEPVIVVLNADPWVGAVSVGDDDWRGFTTERSELGTYIAATGKNVVFLAGDMHGLAADDGTNNTGSTGSGGFVVLHAAPLYQTASQKGGPYSAGIYPSSGSATVQQYGRVAVTDSGSQIDLAYTGYDSGNVSRITLTSNFAGSSTTSVSGTDTVTLTDAEALTAAQPDSDTGTLTDAAALTVTATDSDTGTLGDLADLLAALLDTDAGALSEIEALSALFTDADTGTLADAGTAAADIVDTESALLAEATGLDIADSDTATLTDTAAGSATPADSDTATVTDTEATAATLADTDAAALADTGSVAVGQIDVADSDAAALTDTAAGSAALTDTDTAALTDTEAGSATLTDTDTTTVTDTEAGSAVLAGTDAAALTDTEAGAATLVDTDTATVADTEAVAATLADTDTVTLADTGSTTVGQVDVVDADTVTLTDAAAGSAALGDTESGALSDNSAVMAASDLVESGAATDDATLATDLTDVDSLAVGDASALAVDTADSESGTLSDAGAVGSVPVADTDTATLTDTGAAGATLADTDTATAGDSTSLDAGGAISVADAAAVTDTEALDYGPSGTDTGALTDDGVPSIGAADDAAATDTAALAPTLTDADTAALADDADTWAPITDTDTAALGDTTETTVVFDVADAVAFDAGSVLAALLDLVEPATADDVAALAAVVAAAEQAVLSDQETVFDATTAAVLPLRAGGTARVGLVRGGQVTVETLFGPRRPT